jgi:hypothetical protein
VVVLVLPTKAVEGIEASSIGEADQVSSNEPRSGASHTRDQRCNVRLAYSFYLQMLLLLLMLFLLLLLLLLQLLLVGRLAKAAQKTQQDVGSGLSGRRLQAHCSFKTPNPKQTLTRSRSTAATRTIRSTPSAAATTPTAAAAAADTKNKHTVAAAA